MSNKIDKLFSRKLADHSIPPSSEAWSRIESGLSKKNKFVILWRAAAVFVLLGLLTGSWFYWQDEQSKQAARLATKNVVPAKGTPEVNDSTVGTSPKEEPLQHVATNNNQEREQAPKQVKKKLTQQPQVAIVNEPEAILAPEEKVIKIEIALVMPEVAKPEKPLVIEFTLDPVPSSTATIAEAVEKPALKKIWDKALDIKNGDAELGGLRMAKNELFALDFRKDKSKRN